MKSEGFTWWKALIILTFIISLICLIILVPKPTWSYRTEFIELNNTNMFEYWNVVDYICDDGVDVSKHPNAIYASTSTWLDNTPITYGRCMFEVKRFEGWK